MPPYLAQPLAIALWLFIGLTVLSVAVFLVICVLFVAAALRQKGRDRP